MIDVFPHELLRIGPVRITDVPVAAAAVSLLLTLGGVLALRFEAAAEALEVVYETLEDLLRRMVRIDPAPLIPLILTQWLFVLAVNLVGLVPRIQSPSRDLSFGVALALIAWLSGHVFAFQQTGWRYLLQYVSPHPLLLPFNLIGELSRTVAMALRLFGNMLSSSLIGAVVLYLAGFLVPVPLMLLGVLTAGVQAYLFGTLTLVFSAAAVEAARPREIVSEGGSP